MSEDMDDSIGWKIPLRAPRNWKELGVFFTWGYRLVIVCALWSMKTAVLAKLDERYASVENLNAHIAEELVHQQETDHKLDAHGERISRLEGQMQRKQDAWYEHDANNQQNSGQNFKQ